MKFLILMSLIALIAAVQSTGPSLKHHDDSNNGGAKKECIKYAKDFHPVREIQVTRKSISYVTMQWIGWPIEYCIDKSLVEGDVNFVFEAAGIPLTIIENHNTHIIYRAENSLDIDDFVFDPVKNITFYTGIKCGNLCLRSKVEVIELVDGLRKIYTNNYPVRTTTPKRRTTTTTTHEPEPTTTPMEFHTTTEMIPTTSDHISVCRESYGLKSVRVTEINCTHALVKWDGYDHINYCKEYFSISNDKIQSIIEGQGIMVFIVFGSNIYLVQRKTNSIVIHQKYNQVQIYTKIECEHFCVETKPATIKLKNGTIFFPIDVIGMSQDKVEPIFEKSERRIDSVSDNEENAHPFVTSPAPTTKPSEKNTTSKSALVCKGLDSVLDVSVTRVEATKVSLKWNASANYEYCGTSSVDFKGSVIYLNDGAGTMVYVIDGATLYVVRLTSNSFVLSPTVNQLRVYTRVKCGNTCVDTKYQTISLTEIKN